ncbi:MAG TPA: ABC transporter substrate-binding protein [Chloroflexota bacterium]|nr:ABC transporter substrate-binding protein [Chloroflexota bacterium]
MNRILRPARLATLLLVLALAAAWAGAAPAPGATARAAAAPEAAPARPAPQGLTRVQQGAVVFTPSYIDVYVAAARGLFAEQGLDVESTTFPDPGTASRAFVSGNLDFANIGLDYMIRAAEQTNNNIAIVAGQEHRSTFALISTPDVTSYDGLRGQVVAVVGPNDGTTLLLKRMLAANGLRDGDYDMQVVGGTPNRVAAMQAGVAKAGMIAPPAFFSLLDQGMNLLGRSADYVSEYAFSNHYVRRDWAERNQDTVVRYLAAIVKADRWIADPANKDAGIAVLADATRTSPEAARRTWEYAIEQLDSHVHDGEVSRDGVMAIIEQLGSIGDLPQPLPAPERYVDLRYLEQARQLVR